MIRLAVRCSPAAAERVLAELVVLAPGGVEEDEGPGWVEYAIYGPPGELPDLGSLEARSGADAISVTSEEIPDDWADRWRDFHKPVAIANGRVIIRPSWEERPPRNPVGADAEADQEVPGGAGDQVFQAGAEQPTGSDFGAEQPTGVVSPRPARHPVGADAEADQKSPRRRRGQLIQAGAEQPTGVVDVVIDPGQAFGTGAHATTRLCVELLVELADAGLAAGSLCDLGSGSGVLAITAAKLGWNPVTAVDHEVAAVEAAAANAVANEVRIEARRVDLRTDPAPRAHSIVANLTGPLLAEVARRLAEPPATLVCSGMLEREVETVTAAFADSGLARDELRTSGDWAAMRMSPS